MPACAYCEQDRKTTREHVIPAFMYAFQKNLDQSVIGWNEVANRMTGGEAKVKDVCGECNSGVLGQLDSYGKQLLLDAGLLVENYTKTSLELKYDYELLLRWLLKMSFNSSRTDGVHAPIFKEHVPFILGRKPPPPRCKVAALLYLSRPEVIDNSPAPESFARVAQGSKLLNPFLVRICYGAVPNNHDYTLRVIIIGAAVFHLLLFHEDVLPGHAAVAIRSVLKARPEAVELSPRRGLVVVSAGQDSWLDLYAAQEMRTRVLASGDSVRAADKSLKSRPPRGSA